MSEELENELNQARTAWTEACQAEVTAGEEVNEAERSGNPKAIKKAQEDWGLALSNTDEAITNIKRIQSIIDNEA